MSFPKHAINETCAPRGKFTLATQSLATPSNCFRTLSSSNGDMWLSENQRASPRKHPRLETNKGADTFAQNAILVRVKRICSICSPATVSSCQQAAINPWCGWRSSRRSLPWQPQQLSCKPRWWDCLSDGWQRHSRQDLCRPQKILQDYILQDVQHYILQHYILRDYSRQDYNRQDSWWPKRNAQKMSQAGCVHAKQSLSERALVSFSVCFLA